jgi:hypothetical protein
MRGYIETVTRSLRTSQRRTVAERGSRRARGRRSTFLPVSDEMVARGLTY